MKRFISVCFLVLCCASWCLAQDNAEQPSWKLLTNSLGLRAGDQIVIAVADNDLSQSSVQNVMGTYDERGNTFGYKTTAVDYNSSDSTIVVTNSVTVLTLVEDSVPGIFSLCDSDTEEYLCATHDKYTRLQPIEKGDITSEHNNLFDIWIDENGCAQITGYGVKSKNQIFCYVTGNKGIFVCDEPGNKKNKNIRIFVLIDSNRVEAEGDNPFGDNTIGGVENPDEPANQPVGDVPWFVLACMMGAYVIRKRVFAEGSLNK